MKKVVLGFLVSFLFVGCSQLPFGKTPVTVGYTTSDISLPVFIAQEKGFFSEHGVGATLKQYQTPETLVDDLAAKQIDMGGYVPLETSYNKMLRNKEPFVFATGILEDRSHRHNAFLVANSASESMKMSNLKGKTIGVFPTRAHKQWAIEILKKNGLEKGDYKLIQISPDLSSSFLISGQVDALFTNSNVATGIIENGFGRLLNNVVELPYYFGDPFLYGSFSFRKDYVEENPGVSADVKNALNEAIAFIEKNPEEAGQILARYLEKTPKAQENSLFGTLYYTSDKLAEENFQIVADQYFKIGIISKSISLEDLVLE